jgi:hypothetical protein
VLRGAQVISGFGGLFDDLDRLDVDGHVRRWSASEVACADGEVNQWTVAAQMFAACIHEDSARVTVEQWRAVAEAWSTLLAAAERSTDTQHNEWLFRDLWLRAWLLKNVGPRPDVPLCDPGPVIERALDAMPMSPETAAELAGRWRELEISQIRSLRMTRRLLNPVRHLTPLLVDHPRWSEFEVWESLAGDLPEPAAPEPEPEHTEGAPARQGRPQWRTGAVQPPKWCTRTMFVVPGTPGGEPAVITTMSPSLKRFSLRSSLSTSSTISSVLCTNGTT